MKYLIVELGVLLVVQDGCIRLLGEQRTSWTTINALREMKNVGRHRQMFDISDCAAFKNCSVLGKT